MPTAPLRPCTIPGCPGRAPGGPCARHPARRIREDHRLYGSDWPRRRLDYLRRNPRCALCPRMAAHADHHPRGIRLLRRHGVADPHADHHLRPLCRSCHSRETGRKEPGGWNTRYR